MWLWWTQQKAPTHFTAFTSFSLSSLFQMNRRGFTLIELLVVSGIISILAGLLLSALGRGKTAAQRVNCLNNLRQMGIAAQVYSEDSRGSYPTAYYNEVRGGDTYAISWDLTTRLGSPALVEPGLL